MLSSLYQASKAELLSSLCYVRLSVIILISRKAEWLSSLCYVRLSVIILTLRKVEWLSSYRLCNVRLCGLSSYRLCYVIILALRKDVSSFSFCDLSLSGYHRTAYVLIGYHPIKFTGQSFHADDVLPLGRVS